MYEKAIYWSFSKVASFIITKSELKEEIRQSIESQA